MNQPRKHLARRTHSRDGVTIHCRCDSYKPTTGTVRQQEDAHRDHRVAMGETVKPRVASKVERLTAENERLREQAEAAHIRLWLVEQALQRVDASQDPAGIAGTLGPYLDGPLHLDHIAAYRAHLEA